MKQSTAEAINWRKVEAARRGAISRSNGFSQRAQTLYGKRSNEILPEMHIVLCTGETEKVTLDIISFSREETKFSAISCCNTMRYKSR